MCSSSAFYQSCQMKSTLPHFAIRSLPIAMQFGTITFPPRIKKKLNPCSSTVPSLYETIVYNSLLFIQLWNSCANCFGQYFCIILLFSLQLMVKCILHRTVECCQVAVICSIIVWYSKFDNSDIPHFRAYRP